MFTRGWQIAAVVDPNSGKTMPRKRVTAQTSFDRDRRRGLATCACLTAILAVAIIAGGAVTKSGGTSGTDRGREMAYLDGELRSGAVLFVPMEGNVCRKRVIDNQTWRLRDDGFIECDEAVTWNSGAENQKYVVTIRVDAIRAGFKAAAAQAAGAK
jgi:hypothetical protein